MTINVDGTVLPFTEYVKKKIKIQFQCSYLNKYFLLLYGVILWKSFGWHASSVTNSQFVNRVHGASNRIERI